MALCTRTDVKTFLGLTETKYDAVIDDQLDAASAFLQQETGRQFENQTNTTKTFSTNGRAVITIPDLRTPTTVSRFGSALTRDTSYWLIPDWLQTGIFTGIQLRPFHPRPNAGWWLHDPRWFDMNLDSPFNPANYGDTGSPNDLSINGDWGYATVPAAVEKAAIVLASWYTKRRDAQLANAIQTVEGNLLDYSQFPPEVQRFIAAWKVGEQVALV